MLKFGKNLIRKAQDLYKENYSLIKRQRSFEQMEKYLKWKN